MTRKSKRELEREVEDLEFDDSTERFADLPIISILSDKYNKTREEQP